METIQLFLSVLIYNIAIGQNYIDTSFNILSEMDITYGLSTSFEGNQDTLKLDISYPQNDTPP